MSEVATLIADMVRAGVDPDLIGRTAEALANREPVKIIDEQAERRRAADRERKRLRNSAESAEGGVSRAEPPISTSENPKETNTPPTPPTGAIPPKGAKGSRLPDDFEPDRDYAARQGLSPSEIDRETERFRNHWVAAPGQRGVKANWQRTWFNWVLKAVDDRRSTGPPRQREPTYSDIRREAERQLAELETKPHDHRPDPVLRLVAQ